MKRLLTIIVVLAVVGGIVAAGYLGFASARKPEVSPEVRAPATVPVTRGDVERAVTAPGQLVNAREMTLNMRVAGRLSELNVRPGDRIKRGERLAALDAGDLQAKAQQEYANYNVAQTEYSQTVKAPSAAQLSAARAGLASAQVAYDDLLQPPSENEVAEQKAQLLNAEAALQRAQAAYDRAYARNPAGIGGAPEGLELEKATNDYHAAKARYDKAFEKPKAGDLQSAAARITAAQADLAALTPVSETIAQAQAELDRAYLLWQQAQAELDQAVLVAPMNGVVLEVKARQGDQISAGQALMVVADPKAVEAQTSVIEEDLPVVHEGLPVQVFFDAAPDAAVQGKVSRIVPKRLEGDRPLYPVYISLDSLPENLVPGMSVDASIIIDQATNVLRLPRALVRAGANDNATVEVWANGQREQRRVKVGLRGDTYVEIVEGLREGEEVVAE